MKKKIKQFIEDYEPHTVLMIIILGLTLFKIIDILNHY